MREWSTDEYVVFVLWLAFVAFCLTMMALEGLNV